MSAGHRSDTREVKAPIVGAEENQAGSLMRRQTVPRRKRVVRRPDVPDAKYKSRNVARFTSKLMLDGKRSLVAKAVISKEGIRTSFLPALIDTRLRPEILHAGDPRFDDMVRYMEWASEGFAHRFTIAGDEVVITT